MASATAYSLHELIACAESAVRSMQRRYPNYVLTGRLSQAAAERRIAMMEEIVRQLRELEQAELLV
jgi:hypothetical protein